VKVQTFHDLIEEMQAVVRGKKEVPADAALPSAESIVVSEAVVRAEVAESNQPDQIGGADGNARDQRAMVNIDSDLSPQEAAARMRAARPDNQLPPGVTIRDLMTHGRARE
jgi:hypothetical protein